MTSCIYNGTVIHKRFKPKIHFFLITNIINKYTKSRGLKVTNNYKEFFLLVISVFILNIAIEIPTSINAKVIIINGVIIEGSILGFDNLLIVAG